MGEVDGSLLLLARPTSSSYARRRAERVARRAIREPLGDGKYDWPTYYAEGLDSPPDLQAHAVLLHRGGYGVGIVVLERRPVVEYYKWLARQTFELAHRLDEGTVRWTMVHVWLLPSLRGKGIATALTRAVIAATGESADTIGWLSPFTNAGRRLVARVTASGFHRALCDLPPPGEPRMDLVARLDGMNR
jgi:GNAT superfamily N-acetyltransferase